MFNKDYWNKRVEQYGHTGHGDPFLYCFDQQARLYAVRKILSEFKTPKKTALDYGCGSGDFINALIAQYDQVIGYDVADKVIVRTKERFNHSSVYITNDLSSYDVNARFDLILTVTVLQSFTLAELESSISLFKQHLALNGKIVCVEFFASEEHNHKTNENRITYQQWYTVLQKNQLKISKLEGFYNPVLFPSVSWRCYSKNIFLKSLRVLKGLPIIQKIFSAIAYRFIEQEKDVYPYDTSTFKIYTLEHLEE